MPQQRYSSSATGAQKKENKFVNGEPKNPKGGQLNAMQEGLVL